MIFLCILNTCSFFLYTLKVNKIFNVKISKIMTPIECVRSCDQKPYLHNETKGGICIKIELNPQKIFHSNMAAVSLFTPPTWPP